MLSVTPLFSTMNPLPEIPRQIVHPFPSTGYRPSSSRKRSLLTAISRFMVLMAHCYLGMVDYLGSRVMLIAPFTRQ